MDNDLNTPIAISELQNFRNDVNKLLEAGLSTEKRKQALEVFRSLGSVLSLFQLDRWDYRIKLKSGHLKILGGDVKLTREKSMSDEEIEVKMAERREAKKRKDFERADEIRAELYLHGIIIEDKPDGTSRWKR
jgi:cysteinyl-tRNA synthetase